MKRPKRATIIDVAEHAGVSRATVTLVLQDSPRITSATKTKVRKSMKALDYRYNQAAANLRSARSMMVGLVLADVRNSYFADVSMAVQRRLTDSGYCLITGYTFDEQSIQAELVRSMSERQVDGLILLPAPGTTAADVAGRLWWPEVPLVVIGRRVNGLECDFVSTDNASGSQLVGQHLRSRSVRSVALVGGHQATSSFQDRLAGIQVGLGPGIAFTSIQSDINQSGGMAAVSELLARDALPDALVAYNDMVALGVYEELRHRGIEPGVDIAVAAFDDSLVSALLRPGLTTVATFPLSVGTQSAELLLSHLEEPTRPARRITIMPELRVAESSSRWHPPA